MNHLESLEQRALVQWAQAVRMPEAPDVEVGAYISDYLLAIPNGGRRSKVEAGIMKAEGVKAGVSDLLLAIGRWAKHGLWVEMKANAESPTTLPQRVWISRMQQAGYMAIVAHGQDEARRAICNYLGMRAT